MRLVPRVVALCAAAFLVLLLPAAGQAFTSIEPAEGETQHYRVWPGTVASGMDAVGTPPAMVAETISAGACDPGDGTRTFTFSYADQGVVLWADGRFEEQGTFTLQRVDGQIKVVALDSTFTGSSANGAIEGERHLRPEQVPTGGAVSCSGTSDADRYLAFSLQRVHTEHRLTVAATGAVVLERGFATFGLASSAATSYGHYVSLFQSDQDDDGRNLTEDNCPDVANPGQEDTDGDGLGDACEGGVRDGDGDGVADLVDNCVDEPNPDQANIDGDAKGDACDDAFDSNDGFTGGGGTLAGDVHVSIALHSRDGSLHGSGQLADGGTRVRLLDVTGLRSDGNHVVAVGRASIDRGDPVSYRLEISDDTNAFALDIGDRRWAGTLTNGNLVVK